MTRQAERQRGFILEYRYVSLHSYPLALTPASQRCRGIRSRTAPTSTSISIVDSRVPVSSYPPGFTKYSGHNTSIPGLANGACCAHTGPGLTADNTGFAGSFLMYLTKCVPRAFAFTCICAVLCVHPRLGRTAIVLSVAFLRHSRRTLQLFYQLKLPHRCDKAD